MRHPHKWEELLPEEFEEEFARAPIAYWGCGGMEDHGLHNALGADPYVAHELCLRTAAIAGGIVFPPVPFAPADIPGLSREELRSGRVYTYPPSLWVSREVCERLYLELLESLADLGFRACLAVGGHYPAALLLQQLCEQTQGRVGRMRFWGGWPRDGRVPELQVEFLADGHGLAWETSLVAAVREDWVDVARASRTKASPFRSQVQAASPEAIAHIGRVNAAEGSRWLDAAARHMAGVARELAFMAE
jgi:creatinine amidohydrolase/Fe(II)-dependent formamide hydrolase-like protein